MQLRFAARDISKNAKMALAFAWFLLISGYFFMLVLTTLLSNFEYINKVLDFRNENITFFKTYYPAKGASTISQDAQNLLAQELNSGCAYSFCPNPGLSRQLEADVIFCFGAFTQMFGLAGEEANNTRVPFGILIGQGVSGLDLGRLISLKGDNGSTFNAEIIGYLPPNAAYFAAQGSCTEKLDNSILIQADFHDWSHIFWFDSQVLANLCFVGAPVSHINSFVEQIGQCSSLKIVPADLYSYVIEKNKHQFEDGFLFLLFFLNTLVLVGVGMVANLLLLIERNFREYAVHRLYGATLSDLYLRTIFYVSIIVIPVFTLLGFAISMLFPAMAKKVLCEVLFIGILLIGLAVVYPLRKIKKQSIAFHLRRD